MKWPLYRKKEVPSRALTPYTVAVHIVQTVLYLE